MAKENVILTILFADIANSTRLYDTLGNKAARNLIANCLSLLSRVISNYGGTVIKTIGDEIMCTFPNANSAVEAAIDMNLSLISLPIDNLPGALPPNIYVGLQMGPVIMEDNKDVFGDAVNVAAYMVEIAKQRQIITTEETVESMGPEFKDKARHIDTTTIKGKPGEVKIYEIMWEQKDETVMMDVPLDDLIGESHLELKVGDQMIKVGKDRSIITLGRQSHNDMVIDDIRVSRTHARIEYRRGKYILIDQSTNGTYAHTQDGKTTLLRRDEAPLSGSGSLTLGREEAGSPADNVSIIHYEIKF